MPSPIHYDASPSLTTTINGDSTSPTLKALANAGRKLGVEINNAANLHQYGFFELQLRGSSAVSSGGYLELYIIPAGDGTNYADGDDTTDPPSSCLAGIFPLRAVSTSQRVALWGVALPPTKFKALVVNRSGVSLTNTDDENLLRFGSYNDEVQ